jgi:hypothetical protein
LPGGDSEGKLRLLSGRMKVQDLETEEWLSLRLAQTILAQKWRPMQRRRRAVYKVKERDDLRERERCEYRLTTSRLRSQQRSNWRDDADRNSSQGLGKYRESQYLASVLPYLTIFLWSLTAGLLILKFHKIKYAIYLDI